MGGGGGCCVMNISCCVGDCCVMNNAIGKIFGTVKHRGGCGYHPGPSENELHAKKIADELQDMKNRIRESSEKQEREIVEYLDHSLAEFISQLKSINRQDYGGRSLNLNIQAITEKNEELKNQVIGHIGDYMDSHLVQTDPELSVILEERNDKKRADNFDKFVERLQRESLKSLKSKIQEIVKKQSDMVRQEIEARISEVNRNIEDKHMAYRDILANSQKERAEQETNRMKYIYVHGLCDLIMNVITEE